MASAPRSTTVNGRTVTDPQQVDRIERNREASARYAADSYRREGTPIPPHLRSTVDAQIARGDYGGGGSGRTTGGGIGGYTSIRDMFDGGGPGQSGSTFVGGPISRGLNAVGLRPMGGGGGAIGQGFSSLTGGYTGIGDMFDGGGPGASRTGPSRIQGAVSYLTGGYTGLGDMFDGGGPGASAPRAPRTPPSAGPNYVSGLGNPGTPREDRNSPRPNPMTGAFSEPQVTAPPPVALTGEEVSRINAENSRVPTYEEGGMVGPDGVPMRPSTASLDLPPALARMLNMPMQSYAEGGMVGPGGMPQRPMESSPMAMNVAQQGGAPVVGVAPPGQQGRPLNFAAIDQQAQQFMQQNPEQVDQIRQQVQQAMASGEVDAQSLNMFVQIATTALQNPEMWPQLRQVLIRQGMLDAEDIGEEYDQGFLIVLYIIGKTMGSGTQTTPAAPSQGQTPMSAGQSPQMSMETGGPLPAKSENPDGSIPINAHEGEYVIPADVTRRLGTDHFDKMIAKARGMDGKGEQ